MNIQPIETTAYGCRFRSRLEARWAVFWTQAGMSWTYETEGYATPHGRYLPDFQVRGREGPYWVEVKPVVDVKDDPRWADLAAGTGMPLVCLRGMHRSGDMCGADHRARAVSPAGVWMDITRLWQEDRYTAAWDAASSARFESGEVVIPPPRRKGRR